MIQQQELERVKTDEKRAVADVNRTREFTDHKTAGFVRTIISSIGLLLTFSMIMAGCGTYVKDKIDVKIIGIVEDVEEVEKTNHNQNLKQQKTELLLNNMLKAQENLATQQAQLNTKLDKNANTLERIERKLPANP